MKSTEEIARVAFCKTCPPSMRACSSRTENCFYISRCVAAIRMAQAQTWREATKVVRQMFNRDTGTGVRSPLSPLEKEFLRRAKEVKP